MTSILALFVLLIGGGLFFAHAYLQSQYYVGNYEGRVAIYRGVNQKVLGISLYSLYRPTSVPVSGIPTAAAQQIPQSATGSLAQAERFVANVGGEYHRCVAAHAALQRWEAGKPKPIKVHRRVNGKIVTRTVTPPYHKPKPSIPVYCPQQFSALPHT